MTPLPDIPEALAAQGVALRPVADDDLPFLGDIYDAYRRAEVEAFGWPPATRSAFLADQFVLQHRHYITAYPGAAFSVVTVKGEDAGRLYLYRGVGDMRIVDIAFLPAWCNRGIGGALIKAVMADAGARGDKVSIHVERSNPAQRLYRRLGFGQAGEAGPYVLLEWTIR